MGLIRLSKYIFLHITIVFDLKYVFQHVNASNKVQMLKDIYCTYLSIIWYLTCEIKQKNNNNNPNKNK